MNRNYVFYSVTNSLMVGGVPFNYAIFIFIIAAILQLYIGAFVGIAATLIILLFCFSLYILGVLLSRKDKNWFEIVLSVARFSLSNFFIRKIKYVA